MVQYTVRGRRLEICPEDLQQAPSSVLAEAACLAGDSPQPISLSDWPDPSFSVLQASLQPPSVTRVAIPSVLNGLSRNLCVQAVLECVKGKASIMPAGIESASLIRALDYFADMLLAGRLDRREGSKAEARTRLRRIGGHRRSA